MPGSVAFNANRSAMKFDQLFHNRKAQSKATVAAGRGSVALAEAVEDEQQKLRLDALAGVNDRM